MSKKNSKQTDHSQDGNRGLGTMSHWRKNYKGRWCGAAVGRHAWLSDGPHKVGNVFGNGEKFGTEITGHTMTGTL